MSRERLESGEGDLVSSWIERIQDLEFDSPPEYSDKVGYLYAVINVIQDEIERIVRGEKI